jgi:carbon-monoxide dehydrogenase large subunit
MNAVPPVRNNKTIGERIPRADSKRLMRGRGRYIGDIVLPRMLHLAFVRSPYAHAKVQTWKRCSRASNSLPFASH